MKLLILGGTGRTGQFLIKEALDRGHTVHALVRRPEKLKVSSDHLLFFQGTPTRLEDLKKAMEGCNAVLSALNISRKSDFPWSKIVSPTDLLSTSIGNVVKLAPLNNIDRVIVISAAGAGDSAKYSPGWFKWIISHSNIGITYKDHDRQEQLLKDSNLRWTAVRPVGLSQSEKDKPVRVTVPGVEKPGFTISRKNVARFMLDILEQDQYIHEAPIISE
jgi:putative NADH-flavin reductase